MKNPWIVVVLFVALTAYSQSGSSLTLSPGSPPGAAVSSANADRDTVNYLIRVEWKAPKAESKSLEVLTTQGQFSLNTIEKNPVKINGNDIPTTLKFSGSITPLGNEKARLNLFLGRTVPYVTSTANNGAIGAVSSYQQMSVGLESTFIIKFGKSVVVQNDENGQISVLVTKEE